MELELRPGIIHPDLWNPKRPSKGAWEKIRMQVLKRDKNTCQFCFHVANKFMNVHHLNESDDNSPENLITCCVACHSVLHIGRNLMHKTIEIWESSISQVEIIKKSREGIRNGLTLQQIKNQLPIKEGRYNPTSIEWANSLTKTIGNQSRNYLEEPFCSIFINLTRWQIE